MNADETLDSMAGGALRLWQRRRGYRFSLDSVLLAHFALASPRALQVRRVLDLGTGCGVVGLLLARLQPEWRVAGVELQPGLAELARRNAALNELPFEVIECDWRSLAGRVPDAGAELVVTNPPYYLQGAGQLCDEPERAAARAELHGGLPELVRAARRAMHPRGAFCLVLPTARLSDVFAALHAERLGPVRLRFVHPTASQPANHVLVESSASSRAALVVEPPLIVHGEHERYSDEVRRLLELPGGTSCHVEGGFLQCDAISDVRGQPGMSTEASDPPLALAGRARSAS